MAKNKPAPKKPEPKRDPPRPPAPAPKPPVVKEAPVVTETVETDAPNDKNPQIAIDRTGNGTYEVVDAPDGSPRAITVLIDGVQYQHVEEYQGLWAYRPL